MSDLTWGTVCENDFDWKDAEVICRQENCGIPKAVLGGAYFGEGRGPVCSEEIQCQGNETHQTFCPSSTRQHQNCTHKNDVSVVCSGYTAFRLANGSDPCSGRVELEYNGKWGTVCDQYWDLRDASVLCRQLGCGVAVAAPGQAWFGEREGSVWKDHFLCDGSEAHLSLCATSALGGVLCSHRDDAGLVCSVLSAQDVRLTGGRSHCEGRVEVQYNRTCCILMGSWDNKEASVVCRQLGCGSVVQIYNSSLYGTGDSALDSVVCLTGIQCLGDESDLVNCSSPQTVSCSPGQEVALLCSTQRSLRLVGGGDDCAGRLEVYHSGSWGTICDDSWDLADSQVVCRQLQCGTALSAPVPASFSQGTGPIWLDEVGCMGNESSLLHPIRSLGFLHCSGFSLSEALRLAGGTNCSGRVELRYEGSWGTVCDDSWDLQDAQVVCRQLGCGDAVSAAIEASFGPGSGAIWLDEVNCRGSELLLWDCCHSGLNQSDCQHKEDAGVTCTGKIGGMEDFQYITNRDSYLCRSFVFCHVISFIS
ncbi:DMBT1 protein, partial [Atractosteus spatula]|nr:DMBT1 protein [Atractosteus spatula]